MNTPLDQIKTCLQQGHSDLIGSHGALLGVDLGSYGLRAIAADLHGTRVVADHRPLPDAPPDEILAAALDLARDVLDQGDWSAQQVVRVGLGFGGPVDATRGTTRLSHRKAGWEGFPVVARFEEALGAPALLDNDANVTALGEAFCGVGRGAQNLFYLHLSTGVGSGLVLDNHLYQGSTTTAGEIGYCLVQGPATGEAVLQPLENFVSVGGLLQRAKTLGLATDNLEDIFGDEQAGQQTRQEMIDLLGFTLANVVTLLDPDMIVLGGITTRIGGEPFLEALRQRLDETLPPTMRRDVALVASIFGADSVAVGSLALAMQSLDE